MAIRWRPDIEKWELDYYTGAKRRFEYSEKNHKGDLAERYAEIVQRKKAGNLAIPGKATFAEFAGRWLRDRQAGKLRGARNKPYKPGAEREARRALDLYLCPAFGPERLGHVSRERAEDLDASLHARGLSLSTRRNALSILSGVLAHAVRLRLIDFNPCPGLELIGQDGPRRLGARPGAESPLSAAQAEDYIRKAMALYRPGGRGAAWGAALPLALAAGLRRGELLGLEWRHLSFGVSPEVRIEQSWDPKEGVIPPKSLAARRAVPVRGDVARRLLEWKLSQKAHGPTDRVFPFAISAPLQRHKRVLRALGLPAFKFHGLRSAAASLWRARGLPEPLLTYYMGHETPDVTARHYTRLTAEQLEQGRLLRAELEE